MLFMIWFTYAFSEGFSLISLDFVFHTNFINYFFLIELCLPLLLGSLKPFFIFFIKFVASEHQNGLSKADPKDGVIEPDGPSVVSKDEDDSKVIYEIN